jgi:hypothetical protein
MSKKCETCRHQATAEVPTVPIRSGPNGEFFDYGDSLTRNVEICTNAVTQLVEDRHTPLDIARQICEHDGHFVYFEPRDPEAGASFTENKAPQLGSEISNSISQIPVFSGENLAGLDPVENGDPYDMHIQGKVAAA